MSGTTYNTTLSSAQGRQQQVVSSPGAIASYCGRPEHNGSEWKCNCPLCGKHSLSIKPGFKIPILVRCWHCESTGLNNGFTEQIAHLVGAGLLDPHQQSAPLSKHELALYHDKQRAEAVHLWESQFVEPITPERTAAKYLEARGLGKFIGEYHSSLRCLAGILIVAASHPRRGITAVQRTWLLEDGSDRDRSEHRVTTGWREGAAVWFDDPEPGEWFVIAEGTETCLSAMLLLKCRCGAAVLGSNFKDVALPPGARKIIIAADNDDTGRGASACAAQIWRNRGLQVRIVVPDVEGKDFNDVLMSQAHGMSQ